MNTVLSIIILSYNTSDLTVGCIKSIFDNYREEIASKDLEVIVVDNASKDRSVYNLLKIKNIKLVQNKKNLGFAEGSNIGSAHAGGEYLLFLNSDTRVKEKGFLKMISWMKKETIPISGCAIKNADGSAQKSVGVFFTPLKILLMMLGFERIGLYRLSPDTIRKADWVSGACMAVKKEVFNSLNGFDENLFMYVEDMEFCFRARQKGFSTYFYPGVSVVHEELGSSNRGFAVSQIYRGILYFYKKHGSFLSFAFVKFVLELKAVVLIAFGKLTHNGYLINTYEKAFSYCRE